MTHIIKRLKTAKANEMSVEQFVAVIERLNRFAAAGEYFHFEECEKGLTTTLIYLTSVRDRYPIELQLHKSGGVLIIEPEWFEEGDFEKEVFWYKMGEQFKILAIS